MCSAYGFLYSYRDSKESPIPDINSKTAEDAFNKLLELKTELSNGILILIYIRLYFLITIIYFI